MRKALVVGINEYPQAPLSGCCNDAELIAKLLKRNEDGTPNFEVRLEKNVKSKAGLKGLIRECFSGEADVTLFYYSGHGYIDECGGYLVTPDCCENDEGISLSDLLTIVNKSKCRDKIVILDSCYSGVFGSQNDDSTKAAIREGVTILTACRDNEVSIEYEGHGIFTSLLAAGLSGGAADITGNITPGGLYSYIDKSLGAWAQRPVFKTNVTRFTSIRNVRPQVELSVIRQLCKYFKSPDEEFALNPSFEPTNSPTVEHKIIEPYASEDEVKVFRDLQKLESVGLIVPKGAEHMYFAAMNSKSCVLTPLGKVYGGFVNKEII